MTKEQEEAIETMKHWIDFEKHNRDKINKADDLIKIQETVLNMLKEKDKEIQQKNTELAEKNAEIENLKADNKKINKILDEINNTNYPIIN